MTTWLDTLRQRLPSREKNEKAEIDRIAALQEAAKRGRADFAQARERAATLDGAQAQTLLASGRQRVEEAEVAYAAAMQAWDDKAFRRRP